jgi:hypothetical protein
MGWCRNPQLYAQHHNHLVSADDLDCDRGAGDFWELEVTQLTPRAQSAPPGGLITISTSGSPVYAVSGSSGYSNDPPPPGDSGGPPWGGDFDYYDEERSLADYARIAAPILGVIVLVILLWFWIANFLGDDNGDDDDLASGTATEAIPTFSSSPEPTQTVSGTASPPVIAPTQTGGGTGTATTPAESGTTTEATNGDQAPVDIYLGATVEVVNTGGAGVNVRAEAATTAEVLTVFLDGTQVQVIGGPFEGENYIWWQITGNEIASGWIVEEYLQVVE